MSKVLVDPPIPNYPTTVTVPEDGIDLRTALSVESPFQSLNDRAAYSKRAIDELDPHNWHRAVRDETTGAAISSMSKKIMHSVTAGKYFGVGGVVDNMYASNDGFDWGILDGSNGLTASVDIAAVADAGAAAIIAVGDSDDYYRSVDSGLTWSIITAPGGAANTEINDAIRDTTNNRTVLVGQDTAFAPTGWTSTDGLVFALVALPLGGGGHTPAKLAFGDGAIVAIPIGEVAASNAVYWSSDGGVTWNTYSIAFDNFNDITYNAFWNVWMITTADGEILVTSTPTTASWLASTPTVLPLTHVVAGDSTFLATGVSGGESFIFYTKDVGISWFRYKLGAVFSDLGVGDGRFFGSLVAVTSVAGARMGLRKPLGDLTGI